VETVKSSEKEVLEIVYHQTGHFKGVNVIKVIDDYILTGGEEGRICVWDTHLEKEIACLFAHSSPIIDIKKLNFQNIIASCSKDLEVKLWSLFDFKLLCSKKAHSSSLVKIEPWNEFLFTAGHDEVLKKWRVENDSLVEVKRIHIPKLERFFIIDNYILVSNNDGLITFLDIKNLEIINRKYIYGSKIIKAIRKSNKKSKIFQKNDPYVILFNISRRYGLPITVCKTEEKKLFFGHQFGLVSIWDKVKKIDKELFFIHNKHITGLETKGKNLITSSLDSTLKIFDISVKKIVKTKRLESKPLVMEKIAEEVYAVGTDKGEILVFDKELDLLFRHPNIVDITSVCMSPKNLVLGNKRGEVLLLNLRNLEVIKQEKIHKRALMAIFYSKGRLITIGEDNIIYFLDENLKIKKSISLDFKPSTLIKVKRYISLTASRVLDLDLDEIIKGEISGQTLNNLTKYKLISYECKKGDVLFYIHRDVLKKEREKLLLYYDKEIIDSVEKLVSEKECED